MLLHVPGEAIVTPATLWTSWKIEWVPVLATIAGAALYALGVRRLRERTGRRDIVPVARIVAAYSGLVLLLVSLASPLDALADSLFTAHMLQHTLLITGAAPLVAYGSVPSLALWGLGDRSRVATGRLWVRYGFRRVAKWASGAFAAWLLHALALWLWHLPGPYSAALQHPAVHALEHFCFFVSALILWSVVFPAHRRGGAGAFGALAGTFVQTGALGAILTLSTRTWYYSQSAAAGAWGLSALQDQQLAGLVMWIPPSVVYVGAMLALLRHWLVSPDSVRGPAREIGGVAGGPQP